MLQNRLPESLSRRAFTDPVTILGSLVPSVYHESVIANEMRLVLSECCVSALKVEVHRPRMVIDPVIQCWHKDGLGNYNEQNRTIMPDGSILLDSTMTPSIRWMIVWSNKEPTDICIAAGYARYMFNPFDVILLDNHAVYHRVPPCVSAFRWFVRVSDPVKT